MRKTAEHSGTCSRIVRKIGATVLFALLSSAIPTTAAAENTQGEAAYFKLYPDFLVNLSGSSAPHFLLATVQVMTHDAAVVEQIKHHRPALRDALLMVLSGQPYDTVDTSQTRRKLQQDGLSALNSVMERETGSASLEGLYFTNYVIE